MGPNLLRGRTMRTVRPEPPRGNTVPIPTALMSLRLAEARLIDAIDAVDAMYRTRSSAERGRLAREAREVFADVSTLLELRRQLLHTRPRWERRVDERAYELVEAMARLEGEVAKLEPVPRNVVRLAR
jgi:hypothetical protein